MVCVLTACVAPGKLQHLALQDNRERLRQYLRALRFYIKCQKIQKIVFCDNSNFPYSYKKEKALAGLHGKQLEIMRYEEDVNMVSNRGKGYGEGSILDYVFKHSKLLRGETYFYKITGRLIVKNIDSIIDCESRAYNYFNMNMYCYPTVDTRFFGVNTEVYQKYMSHAYQRVNDRRGKYLEHCLFETLQNRKIPYRNHVPFPIIEGMSGTVGKNYSGGGVGMKCLNTVLTWTRLYNNKLVYKWLYTIYQKSGKGFEDTQWEKKPQK